MLVTKDHPHWKRMRFKNNKVWTAVSADQSPLIENGKVLIKYQLDQPHHYWVHPSSLGELNEPDGQTARPAPKAVQPRKPRSSKKSIVGEATVIDPEPEPDGAEAITIYTDGACSGNPGPAGIGVVLRYKEDRKEISRYIGLATNNVAELEAIRTGLSAVKKRTFPVVLYSDSTYALGVLTKGWKARQNVELVQEIRKLIATFKRLRFVKVKGHAGDPDNELADRLAVQSIESAQ